MPQTQQEREQLLELVRRMQAADVPEDEIIAAIKHYRQSKAAPPGLPQLGMGFPDQSGQVEAGMRPDGTIGTSTVPHRDTVGMKEIGKLIETVSGFSKATPTGMAIGMPLSAFGAWLQGEDPQLSAAMTGGAGVIGRGAHQGLTAAGLKAGGYRGPAWQAADDMYNLRPMAPVGIGQKGTIQGEVTRTGKELADASAKAPPVQLRKLTGTPDDLRRSSLQAQGGFGHDFGEALDAADKNFIRNQLKLEQWPAASVDRMTDAQLRAAATITDIPMTRVGKIKTDMADRGKAVREAQEKKEIVPDNVGAGAQHADAVADRARVEQRKVRPVRRALDRNQRAQTAKDANEHVRPGNWAGSANYPNTNPLIMGARVVGAPTILSQTGVGVDQLVKYLLAGGRLTDIIGSEK